MDDFFFISLSLYLAHLSIRTHLYFLSLPVPPSHRVHDHGYDYLQVLTHYTLVDGNGFFISSSVYVFLATLLALSIVYRYDSDSPAMLIM